MKAGLAWLDTMRTAMKAPAYTLKPAELKRLPWSAPMSVVAYVWREDGTLLTAARDQPAGGWNAVVRALRMDGAPHDRYLELVAELHRAGKSLAAQLGWMQARMIYDPDDQDALYASLFAKPPAIAREMSTRSAAAMLERSFRLATSKAATDRLHLAFEITEHINEAMTDVKGQRRAKFVEATDRAIGALARSQEPAVLDHVRLARQAWARAYAYLADFGDGLPK